MDKVKQIHSFLSLDLNNRVTPNAQSEKLQIKVFGEIWEFTLLELNEQLRNANNKDLEILINSGGGSVFDGVAMANLIKRHEGKTTAAGIGLVASIASVLLLSADVAKMDKDAFLMIHNAWSQDAGEAVELRKTADILEKISNQIAEIYTDKIQSNNKLIDNDRNKTLKAVKKMMNGETWLTAGEALELGLIDEITEIKEPQQLSEQQTKNLLNKYSATAPIQFLNKFVMNNENKETEENKESNFWAKLKNLFIANPEKIEEIKNEVEAETQKEKNEALENAKELLINSGFIVVSTEEKEQEAEKLNIALVEVGTTNEKIEALQKEYDSIMNKLKEFEQEANKPTGQTEFNNKDQKQPTTREQILKRYQNKNFQNSRFFKNLTK